MKTRQFIVLLIAIFLQPIIIYFWFWYWNQHIAFNQVSREQINKIEYDMQHIKDSTDQTLEITAKTANWIY